MWFWLVAFINNSTARAGLSPSPWSWLGELPGLPHGFWSCSPTVLGLPVAECGSDACSSPSPALVGQVQSSASAPALDLSLSLVLCDAWAQQAALITRLCSAVLRDDVSVQ